MENNNAPAEGLIPESRQIVEKLSEEGAKNHGEYGHALRAMSYELGMGGLVYDEDKQKALLRESAISLLEKFGSKVIPNLRSELQAVLTEEDIARFK